MLSAASPTPMQGCTAKRLCAMSSLTAKAWLGVVSLAAVMGFLLFLPAGTAQYWQAWVFLAVFFGASSLITLYLLKEDPALLQRRLRGGPTAEKRGMQRVIMFFASLGFIGLLVVPALGHRFGWSAVPLPIVVVGDVLVAAGMYLTFLVYRENPFTSATIEVAQDQEVISTGPYARVRHPMYVGGLTLLLGMSPALGSYWGLVVFAAMAPVLVWRLLDEERFLSKDLPGYTEYRAKVRWRLIPGLF